MFLFLLVVFYVLFFFCRDVLASWSRLWLSPRVKVLRGRPGPQTRRRAKNDVPRVQTIKSTTFGSLSLGLQETSTPTPHPHPPRTFGTSSLPPRVRGPGSTALISICLGHGVVPMSLKTRRVSRRAVTTVGVPPRHLVRRGFH